MKKFSRTIAMVLILLMLALSFNGCLSYVNRSGSTPMRIVYAVVDIVFLPISLIALLVYIIINDASDGMEPHAYLASAGNNFSTEYLFLMDKVYSLPEAEFTMLKQIVDSMSEAEKASLLERVNSLPETERVSLINAYIGVPETEIVSSMKRINSLSETERASLIQDFESLSEEEISSIIEELEALHEEPNYVVVEYSRENEYALLSVQH